MELDLPPRPQTPQISDLDDTDPLRSLCLLSLLEHDPRPTFVLDLTRKQNSDFGLHLAYCNAALATARSGAVQRIISGDNNKEESLRVNASLASQFRNWSYQQHSTSPEALHFCDYVWRRHLIVQRWIVVSGTPSRSEDNLKGHEACLSQKILRSNGTTVDWTEDVPSTQLSAHASWARSIDWKNTPLGPMREWSPQLCSNASLIMQDPRPAVGYFGPELTMIYNEPYIEILGGLHPCMGRSAREAFAQVWNDYFEPMIERHLTGETVDSPHIELSLMRNGYMEETYFSTQFIPIFDSWGTTIGHYQPVVEVTKDVLLERRSRTLKDLSQELPRTLDSDAFWDHAGQVFSRNDKDVPFGLFYSTELDSNSAHLTRTDPPADNQYQCTLRRSIGLLEPVSTGLKRLNLRQSHGMMKFVKQAIIADAPIILDFAKNPEAVQLKEDLQAHIPGGLCKLTAICPLHSPSSKETVLGFMVLGPRRPYDQAYSQFVHEATQLVSASLMSLILHEQNIGRCERAIVTAELIKTDLVQQLAESQKEAHRGNSKFQRFAERSNIGIFILNMEGIYTYRNEAWYNILNPENRDIDLDNAWTALIDDEYVDSGQARFEALAITKEPQSFELRLKSTRRVSGNCNHDPLPELQHKWVLCSIFPELSEKGELVEIIGSITEISQQKWGEQLMAVQATQAMESKRQLESFIDTTSHEMRNPLSAIFQCADSIISSHRNLRDSTCCSEDYQRALLSAVDSAETIVQCSKHMKTIVDDVLTISKLDSGLFAMTPVDVQLESTARDAVKMFEKEAKAAGVDLQFHLDDSCRQYGITDISLDPTRVLQILINLITNAIKFTRLESKREIVVILSVSLERPTHNADGRVAYIPRSGGSEAKTLLADWELGESIFLRFSVQDTGTGMTDAQHHLLFTRFSQASPRTHIDYGGSGLGLFISRRLTEMHGGAIGFTSMKGVGSTFSFYVQSRRSDPAIRRRGSVDSISAKVDRGLEAQQTLMRGNEIRSHASRTNSQDMDVLDGDLHVLIVEDNMVNQRVLAKQLRSVGMNVAVANHGGEALEYLRTTRYCKSDGSGNELTLVLMDWEMPVMNGLECVANIRTMQAEGAVSGHVPVIAVTANVRSEQVETALRAGMDNVISKPFRIQELRACIQKTLRTLGPGGRSTLG